MKQYNSKITAPLILLATVIILTLLVDSLNAFEQHRSASTILKAWMLAVILFGIFFALLTRFTYLIIDNKRFRYVHMLWRHRWVEIERIIEIKFAPQMIILPSIKAFYIIYMKDNNDKDFVKIYPATFQGKTLAQFIKDIREINPNIKLLDKMSEELILPPQRSPRRL